MEQQFQRAALLLEQRRFDLAERELRSVLARSPTFGVGHAFLALSLLGQERFAEAREAAADGVGLSPDESLTHGVRSRVMLACNRYPEAEAAAREAIRLDPAQPHHHHELGAALAARQKWDAALAATEAGLALDPQDPDLLNLRARLLVLAGRRDEVGIATEQALRAAPNDASSHASVGFMHLNAGDHDLAFEHFREALRLDPESGFAKSGVIEAIKAQNRFYALMLRYFLWMESLGAKAFLLIIGAYVAIRLLGSVSGSLPPWGQVAALVVIVLYIAFCLISWVASPLFNLVLRFHRFGRLVLTRRQFRESTVLGVGLLLSLSTLVLVSLVLGLQGFLLCALFAASTAHDGSRRLLMLGVLAAAAVTMASSALEDPGAGDGDALFGYLVLGGLILGNILAIRPERR